MIDFGLLRQRMVDSQIRTNKVTRPAVVDAFGAVPRELFVPQRMRPLAYIDEDIGVGAGRYLMEPMVLARMLQVANVRPEDVVLVVGGGTGYTAAIVSSLASTVVSLESDPGLVASSTSILSELNIDNAIVVEGELQRGYVEQAPFDVILFDGAIPDLPDWTSAQLANNGRACAVIKDDANGTGMGKATLMVKTGDAVACRTVFDAQISALPGFEKAVEFQF